VNDNAFAFALECSASAVPGEDVPVAVSRKRRNMKDLRKECIVAPCRNANAGVPTGRQFGRRAGMAEDCVGFSDGRFER
jgi:hypothetical protein